MSTTATDVIGPEVATVTIDADELREGMVIVAKKSRRTATIKRVGHNPEGGGWYTPSRGPIRYFKSTSRMEIVASSMPATEAPAVEAPAPAKAVNGTPAVRVEALARRARNRVDATVAELATVVRIVARTLDEDGHRAAARQLMAIADNATGAVGDVDVDAIADVAARLATPAVEVRLVEKSRGAGINFDAIREELLAAGARIVHTPQLAVDAGGAIRVVGLDAEAAYSAAARHAGATVMARGTVNDAEYRYLAGVEQADRRAAAVERVRRLAAEATAAFAELIRTHGVDEPLAEAIADPMHELAEVARRINAGEL